MFSRHVFIVLTTLSSVQMLSVVLAARLGLASRPQLPQLPKLPQLPQLPAGVSAAACPNYLVCDAAAQTDFPTPVVNGQ